MSTTVFSSATRPEISVLWFFTIKLENKGRNELLPEIDE